MAGWYLYVEVSPFSFLLTDIEGNSGRYDFGELAHSGAALRSCGCDAACASSTSERQHRAGHYGVLMCAVLCYTALRMQR